MMRTLQASIFMACAAMTATAQAANLTSAFSTSYMGNLGVTVNGTMAGMSQQQIKLAATSESTIELSLDNFVLGAEGSDQMFVGNIHVNNIEVKQEDGYLSFTKSEDITLEEGYYPLNATWVGPLLGNIPVNIAGTLKNGQLDLTININMASLGQEIKVDFTSCPTLSFTAPLNVAINGYDVPTGDKTIQLVQNSDGTRTLTLDNFILPGEDVMYVGNIVVDGIPAGNTIDYSKDIVIMNGNQPTGVTWVGSMLGTVPVQLKGTCSATNLNLTIDINMESMGQVIKVEFGNKNNEDEENYPQLSNGSFENWDKNYSAYNAPDNWNSFMNADGDLASIVKAKQVNRSTETRPGSNGQYSAVLWCRSVWGIPAQGNLTTGRIHAGGLSATDAKNYNYTDISNEDFCQKLGAMPDSIVAWVKYVPKKELAEAPDAHISAVIHDAFNYIEYATAGSDTKANKAHAVAKAQSNIPALKDENGKYQWQRLSIPFSQADCDGADKDPEYIMVNVTTNAIPGKGTANDSLYVDDITLVYNPEVTAVYDLTDETYTEGSELKVGFSVKKGYPAMDVKNLRLVAQNVATQNITVLGTAKVEDGGFDVKLPAMETGAYVLMVEIEGTGITSYKAPMSYDASLSGIETVEDDNTPCTIYTIDGVKVGTAPSMKALPKLKKGTYIINNQKMYVE